MKVVSTFPLIDGGLHDGEVHHRAMVERMAADLIALDAVANSRDAVRALMAKGYRTFDVARLADDARQAAQQILVAREMSQP